MNTAFVNYVRQSITVIEGCMTPEVEGTLTHVIDVLHQAVELRLPILICGNGGSASDAEHFAAELVCRYKKNRKAFKAIALSNCGALATAISNDFGYDYIFSRQVEAHAEKGGVLIGITTSGKSPNIIKALETGKTYGLTTITMTGRHTKDCASYSDLVLSIPSTDTPLVQQAHLLCYHFICDALEKKCAP